MRRTHTRSVQSLQTLAKRQKKIDAVLNKKIANAVAGGGAPAGDEEDEDGQGGSALQNLKSKMFELQGEMACIAHTARVESL